MEIEDIKLDDIKLKDSPAGEGSTETEDKEVIADPPPGAAAGSNDEPKNNDEADFTSLSDEVGFEVRSNEDIVSGLKELRDYRSGKFPGLSPALQKALDIERQGGNVSAYFQALSLEEDKLDAKEVLQHVFLKDNDVAKSNPKLAKMDFERDFRAKYSTYLTHQSLKDETEKAAFYEQNAEEIEYQKEKYDFAVSQARQSLKDFKEKYPASVQNGLTDAQRDEIISTHNREMDLVIKSFKAVDIPIEGDEVFKLGLDAETAPLVEKWAKNPQSFFDAIGFGQDKIDHKTLYNVMVAVANFSQGKFGSRFKEQILSNKDVHTIENDLSGKKAIDPKGATQPGKLSLEEQIAQAAENKRKQS